MDSRLIEEDDIQSESMSLDDIKHGRLELTKPPKAGISHGATRIELMYSKLSELPPSPNCPLLRVLLLQGNADLMEIPPLFFDRLPLLQTLDLSYTSISDLPSSFFGLMELRVLYLRGCELFMGLPPEIGQLKKLEELDLNGTQITHVPTEVQQLINLQHLSLSFHEYDQSISRVITKGVISKLTRLSYLCIDVNPDHSKWDETVRVILQEISELHFLKTLILYIPRVELLKHIPANKDLDFRLIIGHHMQRIMSRVPPMVEEKFKQSNRSLRVVYGNDGNGVDVPQEIKMILRRTHTFFLDRHLTIKHLSEFGLMNLYQLQVCILAECNEMQTVLEKGHSHVNALPCLQVLRVFYMKNLRRIWDGGNPSCPLLGQLKSLTLHTCPNLTTIFTLDFIHNLVNLEELLVQDCPKVTTLITHNSYASSEKYVLPNIRKISLLYLPELVNISSGLQIGPTLEKIGLYYCPKLQNISARELCSKRLKVIKGETKWWKALRWKEAMREQNLNDLFSPIDEEVDIVTQLLADVDESSSSKNMEIHDEIGEWGQTDLMNELVQGKELARQLQLFLSRSSPSRGTLVRKITASFEKALAMVTGQVGSVSEASQPTVVAISPMAESIPHPLHLLKAQSRLESILRKEIPTVTLPFRLMFTKKLSQPIFTGSKVLDIDGNPVTVVLVDKIDPMVPRSLPDAIKLEIVLLHGDFPFKENEDWTSEQFNIHIVKEGRRSFLTQELNVTMRDGVAPVGDIEFTDNSWWIRSRKFRIAVRVAPGSPEAAQIREGLTEAFVVTDHPMELYEKHYPPMLHDEVWRLKKIGRDGAFHRRLCEEGINTVQDFLKLYVVDTHKLRKVLGNGMSERMWNATIKHAKTCTIGNKLYVYRGPDFTVSLNPICQLVKAVINGQIIFPKSDESNMDRKHTKQLVTWQKQTKQLVTPQKRTEQLVICQKHTKQLVREAYLRWSTLEETDAAFFNHDIALLTRGKTVKQFPESTMDNLGYKQKEHYWDKLAKAAECRSSTSQEVGSNEWSKHPKHRAISSWFVASKPRIIWSISDEHLTDSQRKRKKNSSDVGITPYPRWNYV